MMLRRSLRAVSGLVLLAATLPLFADVPATTPTELLAPATAASTRPSTRPTTQPLLHVERGTLPIILSAPHGGRLQVPGAAVRTGASFLIKKGVKTNFTMAFDGNVDLIALRLADELQRRTGRRPYVVVANFSRRFVDANRNPEEAYESEGGRIVYEAYHSAVRSARSEIIATNQRGLLIDIHGHGRDPDAVIRGTADWTSVRHAVEEFGKEAIVGDDGLLGPLARESAYTLVPPVANRNEPEFAALNGGFITRHYGSYAGGNFDAIQFELGANIRKPANHAAFVSKLADGIENYLDGYLIDVPVPTTQATTVPTTTPTKAP